MAGKKLTASEKRLRAMVKKQLQAEGTIPPDKPKLNRKKFIEEAKEEWTNRKREVFTWEIYLFEALCYVMAKKEKGSKASPSLEAVGAAKVLKIALRLREHSEKLQKEGRTGCSLKERFDMVDDILDA